MFEKADINQSKPQEIPPRSTGFREGAIDLEYLKGASALSMRHPLRYPGKSNKETAGRLRAAIEIYRTEHPDQKNLRTDDLIGKFLEANRVAESNKESGVEIEAYFGAPAFQAPQEFPAESREERNRRLMPYLGTAALLIKEYGDVYNPTKIPETNLKDRSRLADSLAEELYEMVKDFKQRHNDTRPASYFLDRLAAGSNYNEVFKQSVQ